ncbi:proto-oncogene Mas-like [Monodelphis domestica]|uniref:proto-oncogene Mas-like n=1 Tax=Monodelphis domestica TaxID=13616 RepID=UPI0024E26905|nr:proto-oncogene Mas-like [Monodelphis domestica]
MDQISWTLSSTRSPWKLDYDERAVSTPWAQNTPAPRTTAVSLPSLTVLIASCGLIGNGIILWLLAFRIKKGPFAIYILNLTTVGFFFLLCHTTNIMENLLFSLESDTIFLELIEFCDSVEESLLVATSIERCISVLCPIRYQHHCPKHTIISSAVCILIWFLTALLSGSRYFTCEHSHSSNDCEEVREFSNVWTFLVSLLQMISLIVLFCAHCSRCRCSRHSSSRVLFLLLLLHLLIYGLSLTTGFFISESDNMAFKHENDLAVFISCLDISVIPFIYFFVGCCNQRRSGEPLEVLLQRTLLDEEDEEELEDGAEIVCESHKDIILTLWTQRSFEEPIRGETSPHVFQEFPSLLPSKIIHRR